MISVPTVLVLGAGASAPYGFPSGRGLLLEICDNLAKKEFLQGGYERTPATREHLLEFGFREHEIDAFREELLLSMQPSVDAFLENRPKYMEIGKAAMASSLIPYENPGALCRHSLKVEWYEYLFNQMGTRRHEFPSNQLSIVTFNYDRSLEYFLFTALKNAYGASDHQEVVDLLKPIQIVHVYGQLGKPHFLEPDGRAYTPEVDWRAVSKCIAEIKIIPEISEESDELCQAWKLIKQANVICFLGFGYHPMNLQRLRVNQMFTEGNLLGSAYGLKRDEQRRVKHLFRLPIILGQTHQDAVDFLRNYPVFLP